VVALLSLLLYKRLFLCLVHHSIQLEGTESQERVNLLNLFLINNSFDCVFELSDFFVHDLRFNQVIKRSFEVFAFNEELCCDIGSVGFYFDL